jgi:hypothetical protein
MNLPDVTVTDGQLDIGFSSVIDYPMLNGIEVTSTDQPSEGGEGGVWTLTATVVVAVE